MDAVRELIAVSAEVGVDLSPDLAGKLLAFEGLLVERAIPLGLIARSDAPRIRERHVLDSLRAAAVLDDGDEVALDVGSGAGLPGIPLAIARPNLRVHLVEPRRTRVAFLELAVEQLGLPNATIVPRRAEQLDTASADVAFARALAAPAKAWRLIVHALRSGGRLVCFAGQAQGAWTAPGGAPAPSSIEIVETARPPVLESGGPLIIMTR